MIYTLTYWGKRSKSLSFNRWKLSMVGLRIAYFYPIPKQENITITGIHGTVIWTLRMAWPQMWLCLSVPEVAARAPAVDVAGVMCGPGAKGFKAYLPRRWTIRWRKAIAISLSLNVYAMYMLCMYIYIYAIYDIHIHNIWYMRYDIWYIYIYYTISIFTTHVQTKCHRIDISTEMTWPQWPELQPLEIFTVAAGVSPGSLLGGSS